MADLMALQAQRAQQRQQAINEGIEQFVKVQEVKSKIAIQAITTDSTPLRAKA